MLLRLLLLLSCLFQFALADTPEQNLCGLYLAPSSIPNAGLGVFAGHQSFQPDDLVVHGDLVVPLYDMPQDAYPIFPWDDYTWGADGTFPNGHEEQDDEHTITAAIFGMGAAINCMFGLVNVDATLPKSDNAGLHRSRDPGIGAFTPYHDRKIYAYTEIPAGMELFGSYGEPYFTTRTEIYGYIPFEDSFKQADQVIRKFVNLTKNATLWRTAAKEETSNSSRRFGALWDTIVGMKHGIGFESRALHALPEEYSSVKHIAEIGTSLTHYNRSIRTMEWLEEHGKCADNIRPGLSTLPQAGRGAFATRFIPKGGLVAPAPLIHIPDRAILDIYDNDDKEKVVHQQLLLNYCFGHANSTLLLSPYGIFTSLINHSSQTPNAKITWSKHQAHAEWKNMSVESLNKYYHAGLAFDFVALRDIHKNEEILIDYGPEWEDAWKEHVKTYVPVKDSIQYQTGFELNEDLDRILWPYDQYPYYSPNVTIWLHGIYLEYLSGTTASKKQQLDYCMIRIVGHYFVGKQVLYNVEVIERIEEDDETTTTTTTTTTTREIFKHVVFGVPRDAILFKDEQYTRDHQMHSAFRHTMMIPDDMMPTAWKNLVN